MRRARPCVQRNLWNETSTGATTGVFGVVGLHRPQDWNHLARCVYVGVCVRSYVTAVYVHVRVRVLCVFARMWGAKGAHMRSWRRFQRRGLPPFQARDLVACVCLFACVCVGVHGVLRHRHTSVTTRMPTDT